MKIPAKSELPISAKKQVYRLDEKHLALFRSAFGNSSSKVFPPTAMSVLMKGVFEIVNALGVDWRNLLHATQSFEYLEQMELPFEVEAETKLLDCKFRGGIYWMQFETRALDAQSKKLRLTSKTLLLVNEQGASA